LNGNLESSIVDNVVYFDLPNAEAGSGGVRENATRAAGSDVATHQAGAAVERGIEAEATDPDGAKPQQRAA
jgi:hypothetical protein